MDSTAGLAAAVGPIELAVVSIEAGFIEAGFIKAGFIEAEFEAAAKAARLAEREALLTRTSEQLHGAVNRRPQLEG